MQYQLVIQFPYNSDLDFDNLVNLEDALEEKLGDSHEIDGHDAGRGQMNLFILTNDPHSAFQITKETIGKVALQLTSMKAAYRNINSENFTCLWPKDLTEFEVI